jgi:REP element-mobilizing transposase RayT
MSYGDLRKGRHSEPGHSYHVTVVTHGRQRYFVDFCLSRVVIAEMRKIHDQGLVSSLAWVLMPDHLHWLFTLGQPYDLGTAMKLFKGRSARVANQVLHRSGAFWQTGYYDHAVRSDEVLEKLGRYIVANPLRSKLVNSLAGYSLWDAIWV